jgi:hypothetical protein
MYLLFESLTIHHVPDVCQLPIASSGTWGTPRLRSGLSDLDDGYSRVGTESAQKILLLLTPRDREVLRMLMMDHGETGQ